VCVGAEPN